MSGSASIDQRVVSIKFDNAQFEQGVAQSRTSLGLLTKSLQLQGSTNGLNNVSGSAGKLTGIISALGSKLGLGEATKSLQSNASQQNSALGSIANGVESVAGKFTAMSAVGITALTNITNKAIDAGIEIVKGFTLEPIMDGFHNYETQINATQTILANTAASGTTLKQVTASLAELNTYANQTVYNFSDMTKNIGTFTAAGVALKPAVAAIKGIANLGAMSGSTSAQVSTAMYQISQALASGSVHLQDWNSVVNAGLGGKTFQTALENTARASGVSIDAIIKKQGGFRQSLQKGWLTSDILTKTLSQFTGDLSLKQIEAMGYTAKQAESILKLGKIAVDSATKIKTMTQLSEALKEEVATAYAAIFKTIFGGIGDATTLFTKVHTVLENAITGPIYAVNNLLIAWDKLGGRKVLIDALGLAFNALVSFIKPVIAAFREIFPPTTAAELFSLTERFHAFTENLKLLPATVDEVKRTFAGVFAVIKIVIDIVSAAGSAIFGLLGHVKSGSSGFLEYTARIGDFLVKMKDAEEKTQIFTKIFSGIADYLKIPIDLLHLMGISLGHLFDKFDGKKAGDDLDKVGNSLQAANKFAGAAAVIWNGVLKAIHAIGDALKTAADKVKEFFSNLGTPGSKTSQSFWSILSAVQVGLLGGFLGLLLKLVGLFRNGNSGATNFFRTLTEPFEQLTKTLKTMQTVLKAAVLVEIAAAVAILAFSVSILAKVDQAALIRSTTAIGVMFAQLIGAMAVFQKFVGTAGFLKLPFMMLSMLALAGAVLILSKAVAILAGLDWQGLAKGLLGIAGIMGLIAATIKLIGNPVGLVVMGFGLTEVAGAIGGLVIVVTQLAKLSWADLSKGLIGLGAILTSLALFTKFADAANAGTFRSVGIILLATAIKILVSAVKDFSGMSWSNIAKGLAGVSALLLSLALYTKLSSANSAGIAKSVGIVLLAAAIKILVSSVKDFAGMSWQEIGKGLVGVAGLLAALALFTKLSDANKAGVLQGAGILLMAAAMKIFASAMKDISKLSWQEIAKGLVTTGVGIGIFMAALTAIPPSSVISAVAILIVASSLEIVADALKKMGQMSWGSIAKGLVEMGVALLLISAALVIIPPTGIIAAAGIYIVAMSLGMVADALAKMGEMSWGAIAKSLVLLAVSLTIIAAAMYVMPAAIPGALALLIVAAALNILAPALKAMGDMSWSEIGKSLIMLAGAFVVLAAGGILIEAAIPGLLGLGVAVILVGAGVYLAGAGVGLLAAGLNVLANTIGGVGDKLAKGGPSLVKALQVILESMLKAVNSVAPKLVNTFLNIILQMLIGLAKYVPKMVVAAINLVVALINGIASKLGAVINAGTNLIIAFLKGIAAAGIKLTQAAFTIVINFINSLADTIRKNSKALGAAGGNLATAIVQGMVSGLAGAVGSIAKAAENMAGTAINAAKHILDSHSPSRVFIKIGQDVVNGFAIGLTGNRSQIDTAVRNMTNELINGMNSSQNTIDSLTARLKKLTHARHEDRSEIALVRKELAQAKTEHHDEYEAYELLTKSMKKQHAALDTLATKYAALATKIKAAQQTLADATKTRDDFNKSVKDQYDVLPAIAADTKVGDFVSDLKTKIEKTKEFANALQRARKLGLNDAMYKELLAGGVDDLPFVQQIIDGGKAGVDQINDLGKQLDTVSAGLGKSASTDLYQAAVDSAAGLVKGLENQQAAIEKQMEKIADAMVNAIKKKLGIKSPSTVLAEIGVFSGKGVVNGLDSMGTAVAKSASGIGDKAISALSLTLANMGKSLPNDMDIRPTITPVLDLSGVQRDASQIGGILSPKPITVDAAYNKAVAVSDSYMSTSAVADITAAVMKAQAPAASSTYNQYNTSPKALSSADIYRLTKNQLSTSKGALATVVVQG